LKGYGEVKRAEEEGVVGEVGREGFEGEGLKGVGLWHGRGREERRKEQRAKIFGWTNGSRRANGKRRIFWELRCEGGFCRGRGREGRIG
jgi:hypothetical protein